MATSLLIVILKWIPSSTSSLDSCKLFRTEILEHLQKLPKISWKKISNEKTLTSSVRVLIHLRSTFPSYRHQPNDLHCKSIDWFLYDGNIQKCNEMFVFNNIFWGIVKWLDKMFGLDFSVSKKLLKRAWLRDWERACTLKTKDTNIQGCILIY